jgi:predicted anti-sigma-YlaC factor YlaD
MDHPDPSQCHSLLAYLSDYVDGSLGDELCRELETHLAECQDCRIVVDTLRKTISLYHQCAADPQEVPGVVRERLFRTLNLEDFLKH